ncbi:fructosyl amine:oxygen oxidoreductase-like protein [Xylona heveae TC161]|uniref:Fructosyl amine:oxygen oxidoreductase-like protein n=1 Tax=Xylona heveae (strain CBS 132557 / TC161) TaxID=1328760 RepID=A0A165AG03_XYLHT|nr:fructosyl amine:oxygen oxidoreductase-like protein [Xylona heveae TC161]KZF20413.1 fructosyl amine:oxygen oxidoreductase-like protein [Xylona heveae TC161]
MTRKIDQSKAILVIGGGTWGSSTALHLARRGYKNVTVLDHYYIPSAISAGNDVNKICDEDTYPDSEDDPDFVSRTLAAACAKGWLEDPLFKPYYHATGYVAAAHTPAGFKHLEKKELPASRVGFVRIETPEEFRKTMPEGVLTGDFPGWKGWQKKSGSGWVEARKALVATATEAIRLGVKYICGQPGNVQRLLFSSPDDGKTHDIVGVETADGKQHHASLVILAAGANADAFLDFKDQLRPTAWTLAHIKMTAEEAKLYKNLPVLFNVEKGFFMEPDFVNHELKFCDEHPGYCNWVDVPVTDPVTGKTQTKRRSVPFARSQIPVESEQRMRSFLRDIMPHLAERPFSFARICWCADTVDRKYLIDIHPDHPSLVLACGASGHGFKHISSIGSFVVDAIEGKLHPKLKHAMRWRPEQAVGRDWDDVQNRMGDPYAMQDFQKVKEWMPTPDHSQSSVQLDDGSIKHTGTWK